MPRIARFGADSPVAANSWPPYTTPASPSSDSSTLAASIRPSPVPDGRGNHRVPSSTSAATWTLTRNTAPHQNCSSSAPPISGPSAIPAENAAISTATAVANCLPSGNIRRASAIAAGARVTADAPISIRARISTSTVGANDASSEASPYPIGPIASSRRAPNRSTIRPVVSTRPAPTSSPPCRIHNCWVPDAVRSATIRGMARNSTVRSIAVITIGSTSNARPAHSRTPARPAAGAARSPGAAFIQNRSLTNFVTVRNVS